jgi:thioester reductase-like protein
LIDNQWQVDFQLSLGSFEPFVAGTRNLIDFCTASGENPSLLFTSSVGTVAAWNKNHSGKRVPEALVDDWSIPLLGYGESKYVSERLVAESAIPAAICRVGQISGPVEAGHETAGQWNKQEWFPSLVLSSKYLGLLPASLPAQHIDWIPVDALAHVIVDLTAPESSSSRMSVYYNLVNPHSASWKDLLVGLSSHLQISSGKIVPFEDWLAALEQSSHAGTKDIERNPGVKLLDFYKNIAQSQGTPAIEFETNHAQKDSTTFAGLGPVQSEWMEIWLKQWGI